jgi:hypothetical protein
MCSFVATLPLLDVSPNSMLVDCAEPERCVAMASPENNSMSQKPTQSGFDAGESWAAHVELCEGKPACMFLADFAGEATDDSDIVQRFIPAAFGQLELIRSISRWKDCAGCIIIPHHNREFPKFDPRSVAISDFFKRDAAEAIVFEFNRFTNHFVGLSEWWFTLRTVEKPQDGLLESAYRRGYEDGQRSVADFSVRERTAFSLAGARWLSSFVGHLNESERAFAYSYIEHWQLALDKNQNAETRIAHENSAHDCITQLFSRHSPLHVRH